MSSKKSLTLLLILGFIAALLIAAMSTGYVKYIRPKPDETANWKTYNNTQAGFSFKYPSNWELIPQGKTTCTSGNGAPGSVAGIKYSAGGNANSATEQAELHIFCLDNVTQSLRALFSPYELTAEKIQQEIDKKGEMLGPGYATMQYANSDTTVSGHAAIVQDVAEAQPVYQGEAAQKTRSYYVLNGTTFYIFEMATLTGPKAQDLINLGTTVVSTFQFTD